MKTIRSKLLFCLALLCVSNLLVAAQQPQSAAQQSRPVVTSAGTPDSGGEAPRLVVKLGHSSMIRYAAFSPDGRQLLTTSGSDGGVILWDVATGAEIRSFIGHTEELTTIAFSPDGRTVLTASFDKTVRLWDAATGKEVRRLGGAKADAGSALFSPDGQHVLTSSRPRYANGRKLNDDAVRLWDAATGSLVQSFAGHTDTVYTIRFSSDGRFVLTGSEDKTARLWETKTGREIRRFVGHADAVVWADFSPDGRTAWTKSRYAANRDRTN